MSERPILNVDRINQSAKRGRETEDNKSIKDMSQRDRANLSKAGKFASLMENLISQKQNTLKAKNEFIAKSNEDGLSMKDVEVQIETYDEQLKNIESMIEGALRKQFEGDEEKDEKGKKTEIKPVTKEESESKKLNSITTAAMGIERAEMVESLKKGNQNESRILEGEAKQSKLIGKIAKDREILKNKTAGMSNTSVRPLDSTSIDNKLERASELVEENIKLVDVVTDEIKKVDEGNENGNEDSNKEEN